MVYIGIDPGASGGLAAVNEDGKIHLVAKMPDTDRDLYELLVLLASYGSPRRAMLEHVWSSPQMGVASAFKFGQNVGRLGMALAATSIPYDRVLPSKWQKALGCQVGKSRAAGAGGDKNITKRRAQELFPGVPVTHAIADALLLAEYCRRSWRAVGLSAGRVDDGQEEDRAAQGNAEAAGTQTRKPESGRHTYIKRRVARAEAALAGTPIPVAPGDGRRKAARAR